jgi:hypothetical protein
MENISTHAARAIHSDVFRLLVAADACSIQSKVRTQLYEQFMSAQAWIAKAEAIIRKHQSSEYLNLDGLRDFIKSGEKLQGVMVIIDCCEGNLASSAQHPSVADDSNPHTEPSEHQTEAHATSAAVRSVNSLNSVVLLHDLRAELKRGKNWYSRLQATGADKGAAVAADVLEPLLQEIDTICVDFSEQKNSLEQGTLRYCFCRQAYHGQMIGCEECDDWFHLTCIGITKAQADKIDKYICLRCSIRQSFHSTAVNVAMITNRWMSNDELLKWREIRRSKAIRKKVKEERDIQRLQVQISELADSVRMRYGKSGALPQNANLALVFPPRPTVGDAPSASEGETPSVAPNPPANSLEDAISEQIRPVRELLRAAQVNLQMAADEELQLLKELEAEKVKVPMVREWMQAMQGVLWPSNREDLEIGKPLEPLSVIRPVSSTTAAAGTPRDEFSVQELGLDRGLLSEGMQKAHCAAVALNIHLIEDVIMVFEGFKWMSWMNLFLYALRRPMPTRALRLFIEAYKPLKLQDEKITKMLQSWYQRARWGDVILYNTCVI